MTDEYALLQQRIRERAYELWEEAGSPEGVGDRYWYEAKIEIDRAEAALDREVSQSFPASDPPSSSVITGATGEAPAVTEAEAGATDNAGAPSGAATSGKRGAK